MILDIIGIFVIGFLVYHIYNKIKNKKIMLCMLLLLLVPFVSADTFYHCVSKGECIDLANTQAAQQQAIVQEQQQKSEIFYATAIIIAGIVIYEMFNGGKK